MLSRSICIRLPCWAILFSLFSWNAHAGPFDAMERAVMPGKLSNYHVKYENDCDKCHKSFDKAAQDVLCSDCHKEVKKDVKIKKGFHGISRDMKGKMCRDCHTEHKGRDFNIILLDRETFNHDMTDFPLQGGHKGVRCESCHKKSKKFKKIKHREAKSRCVDCHKDDQPHKGRLGKNCEVCHQDTKWTDFVFDHRKTDFPLKGKHQGVECGDCHPSERYLGVPKVCANCHRLDDKHKGRYGKKCDKCHSPIGWHNQTFNHDKDTKFKLQGKHKQVTCNQCHKGKDIYKENLKTTCYSCHKLDDTHRGRYGQKCRTCHKPTGWRKAKFDHSKTKFPLKGKHKKVRCTDCHRGDIYKDDVKKDCYSCHRQDDAHKGQQGKNCKRCHTEAGWHRRVQFDHGIFRFPLLGSHATVPCEQCHLSASFKDTKRQCNACHKEDDYHKQTLGPDCQACHNPTSWKLWQFDHDKQTDFKLEGAHKGLKCASCHRAPVKKKISLTGSCYSCHLADDRHGGSFGKHCDHCHTTEAFDKLKNSF